MKIFNTFIFLFLFSFSQAQDVKVDFLKFKYNISSVAFSSVEILITKENQKKDYLVVNIISYSGLEKIKTKTTITDIQFQKIIEQFKKVNISEVLNSYQDILDGSITELEIGFSISDSISFKMSGIDINKLHDLKQTIQLLLETTNLEIEEFK
ncbi:hypothetical protein [Flavobacterium sp.]|jgi:hypothetical protein|uniref:hypothetical protein n=1 Tax=Flavobacterium sp. TaxID=239 RepID=UPI0035B48967